MLGGYLGELRRALGSRRLIVAGACVLIHDDIGRVLLHRRVDSGDWDVIGGSMEPGETFEETARREVREETGVELGELEVLEVYSGVDFFHTYPNGDLVSHVGVAFHTGDMRGELRPDPAEVAEVGFFSFEALPAPMQATARHHLDVLEGRLRTSTPRG